MDQMTPDWPGKYSALIDAAEDDPREIALTLKELMASLPIIIHDEASDERALEDALCAEPVLYGRCFRKGETARIFTAVSNAEVRFVSFQDPTHERVIRVIREKLEKDTTRALAFRIASYDDGMSSFDNRGEIRVYVEIEFGTCAPVDSHAGN